MKTYTQEWLRLKISQRLLPAMTMLITVFLFATSTGCNISSLEPNMGESVDSLRITRARFVLRDITYKTQSDGSNFHAAPFVLQLNLSSAAQGISAAGVPPGTYRRIEFDVDRVNATDVRSLPASEQEQFEDFFGGGGYSIIISGTTYTGGQASTFTFKSSVNVKEKIDLAPELVLSQSSPPVNAATLTSSVRWFESSSGLLLDPADPQNENTISDNLRALVFNDNNKVREKDKEEKDKKDQEEKDKKAKEEKDKKDQEEKDKKAKQEKDRIEKEKKDKEEKAKQ